MRLWEAASITFFLALVIVSPVALRSGFGRFAKVVAGALAGLLITFAIAAIPYAPALHDWFGPPALLLMGYWISGWLFVAPRTGQEQILLRIDERLDILPVARRLPRVLVELLEASYVGIYPLIPIALLVHLTLTPDPDAERFWSVLLITDYICFIALACVQTRPPRAFERVAPWQSSVRPFNMRLVGAASIQVNTFPSGHAAEALAAALLVTGAPLPVVIVMWLNAVAVSAAAVLGRYHYAADALAGWAVAFLVWLVVWGQISIF
jgi:membrane-associated phospholipid phosphatase